MSLGDVVLVRPATPQDIEDIASFQEAMAWESEEYVLDPEVIRRGVRAVFDDPTKGRYLIASIAQKTAGCLLLIPEWSDWRARTVLWIHSVYVRPEYRRQGVYRTLYTTVKHEVEQDSTLGGLRLYVDHSNRAAQEVYKDLGMNNQHYAMFEWLK